MLPPPTQLNVTPTPALLVRPSASAARWVCSGAETSSASTSLRTAAEVQDQWRSALAASIGGDAASQRDSSLRELLQVPIPSLRRNFWLRAAVRRSPKASRRCKHFAHINRGGDTYGPSGYVGSNLEHAAQAALRMRAGRPQGILPDQLASGLMVFYGTKLQPSEHRAFFELLTSAFGVQRALTRPTYTRIAVLLAAKVLGSEAAADGCCVQRP